MSKLQLMFVRSTGEQVRLAVDLPPEQATVQVAFLRNLFDTILAATGERVDTVIMRLDPLVKFTEEEKTAIRALRAVNGVARMVTGTDAKALGAGVLGSRLRRELPSAADAGPPALPGRP